MKALLDVNTLIAWLDQDHVHHATVRSWMSKNVGFGWATSPITENGCIRIMSHPRYSNSLPPRLVAGRLRAAKSTTHHEFWADEISLLEPGIVEWDRVIGPNQMTDVYLLALAVARRGRLITLDSRIPVNLVIGADRRSVVTI